MIPVNTFEILKTFKKEDLKCFDSFINSPYHNTNKVLIKLFKEIRRFYPEYSHEKLTYESLYNKLYPGKTFSERTIKNRLTEFSQLLRSFLANERLKKDENGYFKLLITELQKRKCFSLSNKIVVSNKNKLTDTKISPEYFMHLHVLEEAFHYNSLQLSDVEIYERMEFSSRKAEPIISHFFSTFFVHLSEHITYDETTNFNDKKNNILNEFVKTINPDSFIDYLEKSKNKYFPYLKAYYLTYRIKVEKDVLPVYKELKSIFLNHGAEFEETDTYMLWAVLCETLYLKLIPSDLSFKREVFELNKYFLNLGIYPNENEEYFVPQVFENIFSAAVIEKEFKWAEKFIEKYGPTLHPNVQNNQINYCLGVLNFKLKKFEKSLEHFSKVDYSDIIMKINLRFYTLLNYIEMKHYESALSLIDSSKHFTSSNDKIPKYLHGYMNTSLKIFKKIILAESQVKELDYSVLKEAQAAKRFFQKSFAIDKIKGILAKQERSGNRNI
ncbi:MAG: hypothetical protein J0M18_04635 [Ignavibacteria bacterium]|nr:hypothetical protein [Ignavibacteria bacterium]